MLRGRRRRGGEGGEGGGGGGRRCGEKTRTPLRMWGIRKTNPKRAIPEEHGPYQYLGLFGSLARGSPTRQPKHPKHRVIAACTRASLLLSCLRRPS